MDSPRLTATTEENSSGEISTKLAFLLISPALFMRRSGEPNLSLTDWAKFSTCSGIVTSKGSKKCSVWILC